MIFSPPSENYALTHSRVRNCSIFIVFFHLWLVMYHGVILVSGSWANTNMPLLGSQAAKCLKRTHEIALSRVWKGSIYYSQGNYLYNGVKISWNKRCWHWQVTHSSVTMSHILLHLVAWLTHKCNSVSVFENHQIAHLSVCLYRASSFYGIWSTLVLQGQYIFNGTSQRINIISTSSTFFLITVKNCFQYFSEKIKI